MKRSHKILLVNTFLVVFIIFAIPNFNNSISISGIKTAAVAGDVWMSDPGEIEVGVEFTTNLYVHTGDKLCAAYGVNITFDPTVIQVKIEGNLPVVEASPEGFYIAGNANNVEGWLKISGFEANGKGPSPTLHLVTITWITIDIGLSTMDLSVETLVDPSTAVIGTPEGVDIDIDIVVSYPPNITPASDITYEAGATGNEIKWIVTDASPNNYTILRDGNTNVGDGSWNSGDIININVDGQSVGPHTYSLEVTDDLDNSASDSVNVNVLASTDPVVSDAPDISFELGETGNIITWIASDLYPDTYTITVDGSVVRSSSWTSNNAITYNADSLLAGTYTIVIEVTDEVGNSATDTVVVKVKAPSSVPGYDILILTMSIGITILGIIYFKRKRL